jgi:pre-mRNA-processing factor 6
MAGIPPPRVSRLDFLKQKPPPNYVAGVGRGATGFTTRSDIGGAVKQTAAGKVTVVSGGGASGGGGGGEDEDEELNPNKRREKGNDDAGLFAKDANDGSYDEDDEEADRIWAAIDAFCDTDERTKAKKERLKRERKEEKNAVKEGTIKDQFADLKRKLSEVSEEEWDQIPEIGDYSIKKSKAYERFTPAPDTLLSAALKERETVNTDEDHERGGDGTSTDLTAVGEARGLGLGLKLDGLQQQQSQDSQNGSSTVDPRGYLTSLSSLKINSAAEISDIKKARLLLKSVINTNPKHAPGWIAAARLEEIAGKLKAAKDLARKACEACPKSEDAWIEAARLHGTESDQGKAILASAVESLPNSVAIWMRATQAEKDEDRKRRVLRKALENVPNSVRLWKALVDLSDENDARALLQRATECCPQHVELWLALARLESYDNARKVLNKARETLPTERSIWVTASRLEEANGNGKMCQKIIDRAIKSLRGKNVKIDRDLWMKEAETCEKSEPQSLDTCRAIVNAVIGENVDELDQKLTYAADASDFEKNGSFEVARTIRKKLIELFPDDVEIWIDAATLEKNCKNFKGMDQVLRDATTKLPNEEILWLMAAKERWLQGDVTGARSVLEEAFSANPENEDIWLAAFKLEFENEELERASLLLKNARNREDGDKTNSARVWMKSAVCARQMNDAEEEREVLKKGRTLHPKFWKLWIMSGQLEEREKKYAEARKIYDLGLKKCPDASPMWIAKARLDVLEKKFGLARATLEQARLKNPKIPELWLEAVMVEKQFGEHTAASALLARALRECPKAGILHAEAIKSAPRPQRKARSVDALKACDDDPDVVCAVARLFWNDRKLDKARAWFNRAATLRPEDGDVWVRYYAFEKSLEDDAESNINPLNAKKAMKAKNDDTTTSPKEDVLARASKAKPNRGRYWAPVRKDFNNWRDSVSETVLKVLAKMESEGEFSS